MTLKRLLKIIIPIILICGIALLFYNLVYKVYLKPGSESLESSTVESTEADNAKENERTITFVYPDAKLTDTAISVKEIDSGTSQLTVENDKEYGSLPVPVKDDFVFSGWYSSKRGANRILSSDIVDLEKSDADDAGEDQILYARFVTEEEAEETELPILMYHWFYEEGEADSKKLYNNNWMDIEEFRTHMEYLKEEEYYFPSWEEVEQFAEGILVLPEKSIVVSIDDGAKSFFELAIPVLNENNIHATGFLIASNVESEYIEKYKSDNIEYGSHSYKMHEGGSDGRGRICTMETYEIVADLHRSQEIIGHNRAFCYPFGHVSENGKEALEIEGYYAAVTTRNAKASFGTDKYELPRVRMSSGTSLEMFKSLIGVEDEDL